MARTTERKLTKAGKPTGAGRPTKFDTAYIPIIEKLIKRGLPDYEIAETLGVNERTLRLWKHSHDELAEVFNRTNEEECDALEATMLMRAQGFERTVQKATASGKVVTVSEYFPPDVQAGRFMLQHRRPEVFREQREVKTLLGVEQGFLTFLQQLDDKAKKERETGDIPPLLESQTIIEAAQHECDMLEIDEQDQVVDDRQADN
jgi:hypothetical protein